MGRLAILGIKTKKDGILFLFSVLFCAFVSFILVFAVQDILYLPPWSATIASFVMVGMAIFLVVINVFWAIFGISSLFYAPREVEGGASSPLVSILVPANNEDKVISGIVSDLLKQNYKNIEVIVVAHNCHDNTANALKGFTDPRIKVFELETNETGKSIPLNFGAKRASGEIIGQFDADNRIEDPSAIENAVRYFSDESIDAIQGRLKTKNPNVNLLTKYQQFEFKVWSFIFWAGKSRFGFPSPLGGTNAFFRRSTLEKVNFWDLELVEDFALYLKLSSIGAKIVYAPDVVSFDEKPTTWSGVFRQRTRWVRGTLNLIDDWLFKDISLFDKIYLLVPLWLPIWYMATVMCFASAFFHGYLVFWYLPAFVWVGQLLLQFIIIYSILKKTGALNLTLYMPLFYVFTFNAFILLFFALRNISWRYTKTIHGEEI